MDLVSPYLALDKAELHCHIDGVLDPVMLHALREHGVDLGLAPEALAARYPITSKAAWLQNYCPLVAPCLEPKAERFVLLLEQHIARLRAQHVRYAEIMLNGLLFVAPDLAKVQEIFTRFHACARVAGEGAIQVEFVASIARGRPEKVASQVERVIALHQAGLVCGLALAGLEEEHYPVRPLRRSFEQLRDAGIGIEIHAGEWAGPQTVWDALEHGFPQRLGHGVRAFEDARLLAYMQEHDIHLEFCPTSNVRTGSVRQIEEHPIGRAHELGMNFSINTDDPGPFGCSMVSEYALVAQTFGLTTTDFNRIYDNTIRSGFGGH